MVASDTPLSTFPGQGNLEVSGGSAYSLQLGIDSRNSLPLRLNGAVGVRLATKSLHNTFQLPIRTGPNDTTLYAVDNDVDVAANSLFAELGIPLALPWSGFSVVPSASAGMSLIHASANQSFTSKVETPFNLPQPAEYSPTATESWLDVGLDLQYVFPLNWEFDVAARIGFHTNVYRTSDLFSGATDNVSIGMALHFRGDSPDIIEHEKTVDTVLVPRSAYVRAEATDTLRYIRGSQRVELQSQITRIQRSPDTKLLQPLVLRADVLPVDGWDSLVGQKIVLPTCSQTPSGLIVDTLQGVALPVLEFTAKGTQPGSAHYLAIEVGDRAYAIPFNRDENRLVWTPFVASNDIEFTLQEMSVEGHERMSETGVIAFEDTAPISPIEHAFVLYSTSAPLPQNQNEVRLHGNLHKIIVQVAPTGQRQQTCVYLLERLFQ